MALGSRGSRRPWQLGNQGWAIPDPGGGESVKFIRRYDTSSVVGKLRNRVERPHLMDPDFRPPLKTLHDTPWIASMSD